MADIKKKLQRKLYESKKARDILDEEFTEFGLTKRSVNEFFDIYFSKFYNISTEVHDFFSKMSIKYVIDYINPKKIQITELNRQKEQIKINIDSFEKFHPIFTNNTVLQLHSPSGTPHSEKDFYLLQSEKKRKIIEVNFILKHIKDTFRIKATDVDNWTIKVSASALAGISSGPDILTIEDIDIPIYQVNTGKELPSNIYNG
tara:strand:- start:374 stop:979 length:606 start_codon:yes stop_codon:yes gene_type:complete